MSTRETDSSFFFECYGDHRDLHSFPTRRSSDLLVATARGSASFPNSRRLSSAASKSRSEEHTSELQSRFELVCRLLPEKKTNTFNSPYVSMSMMSISLSSAWPPPL